MKLRRLFRSAFKLNKEADTCSPLINAEAEYKEEEINIQIPLIQEPIIQKVTRTVVTQEEAIERYIKCDENGNPVICTRTIPEKVETIEYEIVTGYETIQEAAVKTIKVRKLLSNGDIIESCS